ncbi:MAG TPA: crosslink repair DNA glycosylase YcaQ family protein [Candidatus Acidoferrum sp.]|nr:crosslink repair DNA glycosylase YcaQ family protein [Candidatus Acidoferrum sp.]
MDEDKLRAWWSHRQGLDGALADQSPAAVLETSGWARSVGGVSPYLALFARAGITREAADAAVAASEIHELPSARGCTYVLPASDFAMGLRISQGSDEPEMKLARKLGVTDSEVAALCKAVLQALAKGPLDPDELRAATGDASRSLGEEGKKKGLTTTLPLALGRLQTLGDIRRIPQNGRLDQQRYKYTLWKPNPLAAYRPTQEESYVELAQRFFRWIAPATAAEFQLFSGLGVKTAKAALEPLRLVPFDEGDPRLILPEDLELFRRFQAPKKAQYVLIGSLDPITQHRRELYSLLAPADRDHPLLTKDAKPGIRLNDLPSHAILDRGRVVGLWEYDPDTASIAWCAFRTKDKAMTEAVKKTETYVREELGDARSFSLDSPKSRQPRISEIRKS